MDSSELLSRYGEPEAVYQPSRGQTFAGVFVGLNFSAVCFAAAVFDRGGWAWLGLAGLGLACWFYRERQWRLAIFSDGLVQVRPGGVDELLWAEVRELLQTRQKGFGERTIGVEVVGAVNRMVVSPVNFRSRARLFETLMGAAERRGIPVRVVWVEVD